MDNEYNITVPEVFTSYEFYSSLLPIYNQAKSEVTPPKITLDFSNVHSVVALVIPNLLCLGSDWIRHTGGNKISIYLPDTYNMSYIKNFLKNINFTDMTKRFGLFEFIGNPHGGLSENNIDPLSSTLYFSARSNTDEIMYQVRECIKPFFDKYCADFNIYTNENVISYQNDLLSFLTSIINNSSFYGRSFSFTTIHANYSKKKVYISSSDVGCGYKGTIGYEHHCQNELESIFAAAYKNQNTPCYGLYNIVKSVLFKEGKIRFHSNDTQVVFTPAAKYGFINNSLEANPNFRKYNIRNDLDFNGVHIEIELPLEL